MSGGLASGRVAPAFDGNSTVGIVVVQGQIAANARGLHARQGAQSPKDRSGELDLLRTVGLPTSDVDIQVHDSFRGETLIDRQQADKASDQKTRTDQQYQRQRDFTDHEGIAQLPGPGAFRVIPSTLLQRSADFDTRTQNGRCSPENQSGQKGNSDSKREHRYVDGNVLEQWQPGPRQDIDHANPPERQCEARQAADETEYGAFGHELPDQTASSGSHCDPDCGLPLGSCCPGQEQVRDVRAGNQENGTNGSEHDEDCKAGIANDVLLERAHEDAVIGHTCFIQLQCEPVHIVEPVLF